MKNITLRVDEAKIAKLAEIAEVEQLDRSSIINKLIDEKIELYDYQCARVLQGLSDIDNKKFADDKDILSLLLD